MKGIKNLGELQTELKKLIKENGEDSPCVVWMISNKDLITYKGGNKQKVSKSDALGICLDFGKGEYDYIQREVLRATRNGLTIRGL